MKGMNRKKIIKGVCFVLIFLVLFFSAQAVLQVKWVAREAAALPVTTAWDEYKSMEKDSIDVFFMGTSHTYFATDPMFIYDKTGIASYTLAMPALRMDLAHMVLQEALKTQTPKVVFLDMSAITYKSQIQEAKGHKTIDQMPISLAKIVYAFNNNNKKMKPLEVLFPFFRYHSRWSELGDVDFSYLTGSWETTFSRGHYPTFLSEPAEIPFYNEHEVADQTRNIAYMKEIKKMCDEVGADLVLMKIPAPAWRESLSKKAEEIAQMLDVPYLEMFYALDEIGLNLATDYRDHTDHINQWGAEKISTYLMNYLQEHYDLEDRRATYQRWNEDLIKYKEELQMLQAEGR